MNSLHVLMGLDEMREDLHSSTPLPFHKCKCLHLFRSCHPGLCRHKVKVSHFAPQLGLDIFTGKRPL
ncbi:Uncharacterized protein HZ326_25717 [Fusarium oxysporum f. sp. albedinis]|nr:Uncharacterized protein HZ326_25717 [Fusarium oxysporum f. sp. albedinis]